MGTRRLRVMTRTVYDVQDFRIRVGGRIVQNFRAKLGLDDGESDEDKEVDILRRLQVRYKRVTDGIAWQEMTKDKDYDFDGVISNYGEVAMLQHYFRLCDQEEDMFKDLKHEVEKQEIWQEFLVDVKGIGPAMASVIISEFDPREGKYVSSFWKYAGLDTVDTWHKVVTKGKELDRPTVETPPSEAEISEDGETATLNGSRWEKWRIARSRRRQHLREIEYENSDGEMDTRKGLTFNPFLHDKLLGVAGPCLLRAGGEYKKTYDDYKHRIQQEGKGRSDGHRHRMAIRYMVKMLVKDLYKHWRPLVGLPAHDPYAEAKLEGQPHGDSE